MFKWVSRNVGFYRRAEEAIFLLQNLNDDDIADERARFALKRLGGSEFDIFCSLYYAWCSISITAKYLIDMGYELSPEWEARLVSASDHLILYLYPLMSVKDQGLFERNMESIFSNALRTNPYSPLPPVVEKIKTEEV